MKIRLTLLFCFFLETVFSQTLVQKLPEAGLQFILPDNQWSAKKREKVNGNMILYNYKREPITDSLNRGIIANISVLIEDIENPMKVSTYSIEKRKEVAFAVSKILTWKKGDLMLQQSIGYEGSYVDQNKNLHRIVVVHAVWGKKGVQFICDATDSIWPMVKAEFLNAAKSLNKPFVSIRKKK